MGNICNKSLDGERNILNIENFNELPEFILPQSPESDNSTTISSEILAYIDLDIPNHNLSFNEYY
jgi:hypothetical protein